MNDLSKGNPKAVSVRIKAITTKNASGQRRHDLRIGKQPNYVDEHRKHLNRVIVDVDSSAVLKSLCLERRQRRDTKRAMKSNAAVGISGVITFGTEAAGLFNALKPEQQDEAFKALTTALAERLNTSVHGLVVHLDETTIHAHFTLAAVDNDGNPVVKSTSPAALSSFQDLAHEVMRRRCPGIERGRRYGDRIKAGADYADTLHRSVKRLHQDLPAEIAAKEREATQKEEKATAKIAEIADLQQRVDEMQERVDKLKEKEDLSDKEVKRLQTYEKRLRDRISELNAAVSEKSAENQRLEIIASHADDLAEAANVLADEIREQTIFKDSNDKVIAQHAETLKKGFPELKPAVKAAAEVVTAARTLHAEAEALKKSAEADRKEAKSLLKHIRQYFGRLLVLLKRPDVPNGLRVESERMSVEGKALYEAIPSSGDDDFAL